MLPCSRERCNDQSIEGHRKVIRSAIDLRESFSMTQAARDPLYRYHRFPTDRTRLCVSERRNPRRHFAGEIHMRSAGRFGDKWHIDGAIIRPGWEESAARLVDVLLAELSRRTAEDSVSCRNGPVGRKSLLPCAGQCVSVGRGNVTQGRNGGAVVNAGELRRQPRKGRRMDSLPRRIYSFPPCSVCRLSLSRCWAPLALGLEAPR
jgi:hypothetical protein